MEKKGYREPIKASLEEILERNAQINEIKERFDKLEASVMSIKARKYNTKLHKYEDVLLPDECRTYEEDMEKMVPCAQCGRLHKYGEMYTSREVHTAYGFGFAVCRECYDDEMDRFLAEHPPFKEN